MQQNLIGLLIKYNLKGFEMHLAKREKKHVFMIDKLQGLKLLVMILENQYWKSLILS